MGRKAIAKHNKLIRKFSVIYHRAAVSAAYSSGVPAMVLTNGPGGKNLSVWVFSSSDIEACMERKASSLLLPHRTGTNCNGCPVRESLLYGARTDSHSGGEVSVFMAAGCCSCL